VEGLVRLSFDPVTAIVEAFRTNDVVMLTDPHGNVQIQNSLLALVRDPRFPESTNDTVIESVSARYQDVIGRFVQDDSVESSSERDPHIW
jgi:hypothetical protein